MSPVSKKSLEEPGTNVCGHCHGVGVITNMIIPEGRGGNFDYHMTNKTYRMRSGEGAEVMMGESCAVLAAM